MTTNLYNVYAFESVLAPTRPGETALDLLRTLDLRLSANDPRWSKLEKIVGRYQALGYNFDQGRATLALLAQRVIRPHPETVAAAAFFLQPDDDDPSRQALQIQGRVKDKTFNDTETVRKSALIALPHILKTALTSAGLAVELQGIRVEDGTYLTIPTRQGIVHRATLYFEDKFRDIGWWACGARKNPFGAVLEAAVSGYRFALDPRRQAIPIDRSARAAALAADAARENPREYRKRGVCWELLF